MDREGIVEVDPIGELFGAAVVVDPQGGEVCDIAAESGPVRYRDGGVVEVVHAVLVTERAGPQVALQQTAPRRVIDGRLGGRVMGLPAWPGLGLGGEEGLDGDIAGERQSHGDKSRELGHKFRRAGDKAAPGQDHPSASLSSDRDFRARRRWAS
jgi:hypothetical protein